MVFWVNNMQIILIYGPTASGKSDYAIKIAKEKNGIIINADAQQIYKEIPIITAQPILDNNNTIDGIEHLLYGFLKYIDHFSVSKWLACLKEQIEYCNLKDKTPIIVGGTGLYIKSLCDGILEFPELDQEKLLEFMRLHQDLSTHELYHMLEKHDPNYATQIHQNDRQRILRALSFSVINEKPYSSFLKQKNVQTIEDAKFFKIYIKPNRNRVYENIKHRIDKMFVSGFVEEVKSLIAQYPDAKLNKAIGLEQINSYIKGECSLEQAFEKMAQLTRNYAKRQYTWFNNQLEHDEVISD